MPIPTQQNKSKAKQLGVGAICAVQQRRLHPKKLIQDTLINASHLDVVEDLLVTGLKDIKVNSKMQRCITFRHEKFEGKEIYTVKRWAKIITEGSSEHFFCRDNLNDDDVETSADNSGTSSGNPGQADASQALPSIIRNSDGSRAEDIALIRAMGFEVDDDNEPAPENIPEPVNQNIASTNDDQNGNASASAAENNFSKFGEFQGVDYRKAAGCSNVKPKLIGMSDEKVKSMTYLDAFLLFFPKTLFDIIVNATNSNLEKENLPPIEFGELLKFIGLWLFMATTSGYSRRQFWSVSEIHPFDGSPYRFHSFMTFKRFESIRRCIGYTNQDRPSFVDRFWEVRVMIEQWNAHMTTVFSPSWVSCLDESMSIWYSKWTCPGWMFVPRKPHPYGNEYHSISCGLSSIMYQVELVEGKEQPSVYKAMQKHPHGNTVGLLLRLCACLFGTRKLVVLDSDSVY